MRALVVEDDPRVGDLLERGLTEAAFVVEVVSRGDEALQLGLVQPYDVIVLDLMLPGRSGLEVLRALRAAGRPTPILVLTARDEIEDRVRALDAGADDYLCKPFAFAELLARLRCLLRRGTVPASVLAVGDLRVDLLSRQVWRGVRKIDLTAKEFALLEFLARHAGQVVTRSMIAEHVWDTNSDCFTNVIDVYIGYLRKKVDVESDSKLIHTRRGVGYLLTPEP